MMNWKSRSEEMKGTYSGLGCSFTLPLRVVLSIIRIYIIFILIYCLTYTHKEKIMQIVKMKNKGCGMKKILQIHLKIIFPRLFAFCLLDQIFIQNSENLLKFKKTMLKRESIMSIDILIFVIWK